MSALEHRLAVLDSQIANARAKAREVEGEKTHAGREASRARAARATYDEGVGAGESDPDPKEEKRLDGAIAAAERAADGAIWDARIAGAQRAVDEAETARDEFAREHVSEIVAEGLRDDEAARDRLQGAWEELDGAEAHYATRVRRAVDLARHAGLPAEDVPELPTRGDESQVRGRFRRGIESPTPRSLRSEEVAA